MLKFLVRLAVISAIAVAGSAGASRSSIECDSAIDCLALWPASGAPNEKPGEVGPESRAGNDGHGCGPLRNIDCDHIFNVTAPTLTPFLVNNGTGAAIVISPGGGYRDLAWTKEGLDVARMYNEIGQWSTFGRPV
jgi:hypothetical protein